MVRQLPPEIEGRDGEREAEVEVERHHLLPPRLIWERRDFRVSKIGRRGLKILKFVRVLTHPETNGQPMKF